MIIMYIISLYFCTYGPRGRRGRSPLPSVRTGLPGADGASVLPPPGRSPACHQGRIPTPRKGRVPSFPNETNQKKPIFVWNTWNTSKRERMLSYTTIHTIFTFFVLFPSVIILTLPIIIGFFGLVCTMTIIFSFIGIPILTEIGEIFSGWYGNLDKIFGFWFKYGIITVIVIGSLFYNNNLRETSKEALRNGEITREEYRTANILKRPPIKTITMAQLVNTYEKVKENLDKANNDIKTLSESRDKTTVSWRVAPRWPYEPRQQEVSLKGLKEEQIECEKYLKKKKKEYEKAKEYITETQKLTSINLQNI